MKAFNGYENAKKAASSMGGERLPAGAYVCQVKNVRYVAGENGNSDMIEILFDITEGEFKGFFKKQYDENTSEDKKFKGRKSIYVPKDDGSERDEWTKNSFAKWVNAFEDSNEGYKWDWNENKWKGLSVGIVFGETGTVIEGREIVYTEARFPADVKKVRAGTAPKAKFVAKNGYTGNGSSNNGSSSSSSNFNWQTVATEEELPFS